MKIWLVEGYDTPDEERYAFEEYEDAIACIRHLLKTKYLDTRRRTLLYTPVLVDDEDIREEISYIEKEGFGTYFSLQLISLNSNKEDWK